MSSSMTDHCSGSSHTSDDFDTLVDNLKKWYVRKQVMITSDAGIPVNISEVGSDIESYSNRSNSISNPTITIETISNKKNTVKIPDKHVVIAKQLLNTIMDHHHKTNELLHRILPPRVVKELRVGNQVKPEEYESVTILFSDIVGMNTHNHYYKYCHH